MMEKVIGGAFVVAISAGGYLLSPHVISYRWAFIAVGIGCYLVGHIGGILSMVRRGFAGGGETDE